MIYTRTYFVLLCLLFSFKSTFAFTSNFPSGTVLSKSRVSVNSKHGSQLQMNKEQGGTVQDIYRKTVSGILGAMVLAQPFSPLLHIDQAIAADYKVEGSKYSMGKSLNAPTGSGTRVNKDADSLLRYGLPISSKEARTLQATVESIKDDIRIKRWGPAIGSVQKARNILTKQEAVLLKAVRKSDQEAGKAQIAKLKTLLDPLEEVLGSKEGSGTVQEREKLDQAYAAQELVASAVGDLEQLMVPEGFFREIPEEYEGLPYLQGRAQVEMVIVKGPDDEDGKFNVEGTLYDECRLTLTLDGYNAPITAGNIMDLVDKGFYNGLQIIRSDGFVVQTGDPDPESNKVDGYIPKGSSQVRTIPLEISVVGDKELLYGATTEDDGRGFVPTVLPFQAYGALGMARSEGEADSASSQFFFLLFDSDLTPAGKNLLDGRYTEFGYVTTNADILKDVKEGDIIQSAKILNGKDRLVQP
mmetsp:Transcript_12480/g.16373  ORF Transcript_12480/g.16373 Transcript_12480/m.16373 type:complete len:470 (+) Transcript_12480:105-1514(+)